MGVVVVGDVAHVVVDPVLDGEPVAGDPGEMRVHVLQCSAGGSVPWWRHTTIGTSQISHSAIQHTSSSWYQGVMRAASQRSQPSTVSELRLRRRHRVTSSRRGDQAPDLGALPGHQHQLPVARV